MSLLLAPISTALLRGGPNSPPRSSMVTDDFFLAPRNPPPTDPARNLKPNNNNPNAPGVAPHSYSTASPSHLALSADLQGPPPPGQPLPNPYHYSYGVPSHDPSQPFAFPQTGYRPQIQTIHPPLQYAPGPGQPSPTSFRKRRASELDGTLPGSASSSASAFANPTGLLPGGGELDGPSPGPPNSAVVAPPPPQVVKKGRTNTPWTPAEEQRLKALRDAGSSWSEIAKTFPTRTEGSVKKHWYKDMHYAEFAADEVSSFEAALLQAIKDYENNKWKVIGQKVGKPAKACEQFAKEHGWKV